MTDHQQPLDEIAFLERVMRYQDGVLTPEEGVALEQEMMASPEKRRLFTEAQMRSMSILQRLRQDAYRVVEPVRYVSWWNRLRSRPLVPLAAGVVVVAIIASIVLLPQASASPAAILRHALKAHAAALDRCYRFEVTPEPVWQQTSRRSAMFESRLWTRGDRFWMETRTGEQTVAWGRDEHGFVWFALSPELGALYEPDEVSERLALACDLRSLQIESLLHTVLADFDLRREPGGAGSQIIHAQLKAGRAHPLYRAALLEVDTESGVLRRVAIHRVLRGQPAVVTFTLLETSLQAETAYTLAGHLTPQATVYDRQTEPDKRKLLLDRLFNAIQPSDAKR
jgi:hypothetical protein